jgi:hypothetical protein
MQDVNAFRHYKETDASKEVGLEVNIPDCRQNHYIKVANKSLKNLEKLKCLQMTLTA